MTLLEEHPTPHAQHDYTRWAWIAIGVTPLLVAAGIAISLAASGVGPGLGGALIGLLSLAAPTAALLLGGAAARAKQSGADAAVTTGAVVWAGCVILLPVGVISVTAWLIALAVSVVVLLLAGWRRLAR